MTIEPKRDPDQVYAATTEAITASGWQAQPIDKRNIRVLFHRDQYEVVLFAHIEGDSVSLTYQSSTNLDYEQHQNGAVIHKAYREWSQSLMDAIRSKMTTLCPDFTPIAKESTTGIKQIGLISKFPSLGAHDREFTVRASNGAETGYVVKEYTGFVSGSPHACQPISAIYYRDTFVDLMPTRMETAALIAYSDVLKYLVAQNSISFSDAELERMSIKVDAVSPLDPPRREELLRFVEWQAQRFERHEIQLKEYEYLLAQKEAEVQERQAAIDQKEAELKLLRTQQTLQSDALEVQRRQLAAQRSLVIGQALQNLSQSMSYRPTFTSTHCSSRAVGSTVYTDCN